MLTPFNYQRFLLALIVLCFLFLTLFWVGIVKGEEPPARISLSVDCANYNVVPNEYFVNISSGSKDYVEVYAEFDSQGGEGIPLALGFDFIMIAPGTQLWGRIVMNPDHWVHLNAIDSSFRVLDDLKVSSSQKYRQCGRMENQWRPSAPSVYVEAFSDCFFLEVIDKYGHWSFVTVNGVKVLLHYGEALIASPYGQTTNPLDYRPVETACPA